MNARKIKTPEVIAGIESQNVGRLTAMWTVVAFERAGGEVSQAQKNASELGCERGFDAVMRHVNSLPEGQRGFITGEKDSYECT